MLRLVAVDMPMLGGPGDEQTLTVQVDEDAMPPADPDAFVVEVSGAGQPAGTTWSPSLTAPGHRDCTSTSTEKDRAGVCCHRCGGSAPTMTDGRIDKQFDRSYVQALSRRAAASRSAGAVSGLTRWRVPAAGGVTTPGRTEVPR